MKKHILNTRHESGGAMIMALITVAVLTLLMGTVMISMSNKYSTISQISSWQEALYAAESGADLAMGQLRKDMQNQSAWAGWKEVDLNNGNLKKTGDGSNISITDLPNNTFGLTYSTTLSHAGEGNTAMRLDVTVDAPKTLVDSAGRQWYRVRASGGTDLTKLPRASDQKYDNMLRKFSLKWDSVANQAVTTPRVTRTIEAIAKPIGIFSEALMTQIYLKNGKGLITTDSYDSTDPTKSTNGVYDGTIPYGQTGSKIQANGDVASNAWPDQKGKTFAMNMDGNTILGDVGDNYTQILGIDPGYFTKHPNWNTTDGVGFTAGRTKNNAVQTNGSGQVQGDILPDYYRDLPQISDPTWTVLTDPTITKVDKSRTTTIAGTASNPSRYKLSTLNLDGKDLWVLKPKDTKQEYYVEIWVTGDINLHSGGSLQIQPGVNATIYFDKNLTINDNKTDNGGFDVQSDQATDLVLLGVEQPDNKKDPDTYTPAKASGKITIQDSDFVGAIYAPDHNIVFDSKKDLKGKRKNRQQNGAEYYGAFVGRTIEIKKPTDFHYDEALVDVGPIRDYGFVSWVELRNLDGRVENNAYK